MLLKATTYLTSIFRRGEDNHFHYILRPHLTKNNIPEIPDSQLYIKSNMFLCLGS